MGVELAVPTGLPAAVERGFDEVLAPLQVTLNGFGRWVNPVVSAGDLRIQGTGNSWTLGGSGSGSVGQRLSYALLGDTMLLNVALFNSTIVLGTATNFVSIRIPDGYRVAGASPADGFHGRLHTALCYLQDGDGTVHTARLYASPQSAFVNVQKLTAANFAAGAVFTVWGQIALEVVRASEIR